LWLVRRGSAFMSRTAFSRANPCTLYYVKQNARGIAVSESVAIESSILFNYELLERKDRRDGNGDNGRGKRGSRILFCERGLGVNGR